MKALRILVVEDEPLIGILLAEVANRESTIIRSGLCLAAAVTAPTSVASIAQTECPIPVSIGSGVSAVAKILLTGFIPHVFVTGDALTGAALSPRAVAIRKPFRDSDLVQAMQVALGLLATERAITPESAE